MEIELNGNTISEGMRIDFGTMTLTEDEIVEYAKRMDPLPFHIDRDAAAKTRFGGIIASGTQPFVHVHKSEWIPRFGKTVVAGLSLEHWVFLKPVYPDMPLKCTAEVLEIKTKPEKQVAIVKWKYYFYNENQELVQSAEYTVLHNLSE